VKRFNPFAQWHGHGSLRHTPRGNGQRSLEADLERALRSGAVRRSIGAHGARDRCACGIFGVRRIDSELRPEAQVIDD